MYAERVTLTRPARPSLPERVRLVATIVGVATLAAAAATALQWPLWRVSPLLAAINTALAIAHAAVAPLLREPRIDPRRQPVPWAFGVAGVCRAGTWVGLWNDGIPPLVGHLFNSAFWLLVGATILLWSRRRPNRWERRYLLVTTIVMVGGDLGLPSTDSAPVRAVFTVLDLVLIALFLALVARRLGQASGLERRALRTAQLPAVVTALAVLIASPLAGSLSPEGTLWVPTLIGIALLALPITVVATTARVAAERADVADAVTGLAWPASPRLLQSALRRALRDPTIEIGYWVDGLHRYVDAEGRSMDEPASDRFAMVCQDDRGPSDAEPGVDGSAPASHQPGVADDHRPVAILVGGSHHRHRPDLVTTAMQTAGPAFALAGLQVGLRAERRDLTEAHREVEESRWAERRRLEQNLHDGAQHRLAALTMRLGAASATVPLEARARDLVGEIQDEIREVLRELRELADGIHPSTLTEAGLGPALEAVADRFPVRLTITAPARRFPPVVEAVAYYSTTEVLTIVTRQLNATEIRVEVSARGGDLWVRTTGRGVDARSEATGRYFAPLGSGIRAIGGELLTLTTHGDEFAVAARIPCE